MKVNQISLRPLSIWTANNGLKMFSSSTSFLKKRSCFPSLSFLTYTPLPKLPWENQVYFVFIFISCISKLSLAALLGLHSHTHEQPVFLACSGIWSLVCSQLWLLTRQRGFRFIVCYIAVVVTRFCIKYLIKSKQCNDTPSRFVLCLDQVRQTNPKCAIPQVWDQGHYQFCKLLPSKFRDLSLLYHTIFPPEDLKNLRHQIQF